MQSSSFRKLFVGTLLAASVGVTLLTGAALLPAWREKAIDDALKQIEIDGSLQPIVPIEAWAEVWADKESAVLVAAKLATAMRETPR